MFGAIRIHKVVASPPRPPLPPFAPSPAILLQRRVRSDAFAECANQLANEDATSIVATAPMSRNLIECQSFIFSLKFVLGQWFICIKLFYSLKFPVRYTDIIVEGVILLYLFLPMFYGIVSAHKVAVLTLASKNSGYL